MSLRLPARVMLPRGTPPRLPARAVVSAVALGLALTVGAHAASPLAEACVLEIDGATRNVRIRPPEGRHVVAGTRLLLTNGGRPLAWGRLIRAADGAAEFTWPETASVPVPAEAARAWLVGPDVVAELLDTWPAEAALQAEVDALGPGAASAWLRIGQNQGVHVGHTFWLRHHGQAVARCDVRYVSADLSHAALVPLVADLRLRAGDGVALWPAPEQERCGAATSAVSYIEPQGSGVLVWIAAPRGVAAPAEPHVDFFHDGQYVGHGLVERGDERFWYAMFHAAPARAAVSQPTTAAAAPAASLSEMVAAARPASAPAGQLAAAPASRPTAAPTTLPVRLLRVGDDVVIRTQADLDARRFVARVFERTTAGALVNAGEADGLAPQQEATLYREGALVGRVRIRSTQRTYAAIEPVPRPASGPQVDAGAERSEEAQQDAEAGGMEIRLGDELRFVPPREAPAALGTIAAVKDTTLITVSTNGADVPLGRPLAVRWQGRVVGVAVLVAADDGLAGGFVLPCAAVVPVAPGMELVAPVRGSTKAP